MPDFTQSFVHELSLVSDIGCLIGIKELIKEQVTNTHTNWQERILLYTKVRLVNKRIQELEMNITSTGK